MALKFKFNMFQDLNDQFLKLGITNFIVLFEDTSWKLLTLNVFNYEGAVYELATTSPNAKLLFPDKQKNLEEFTYKVGLIEQAPRIKFEEAGTAIRIAGIEVQIFSIISKHQNATWQIVFLQDTRNDGVRDVETVAKSLSSFLYSNNFGLTLNTGFKMFSFSYRSMINTYDIVGYCALVPIPPRLLLLHFLLTPFDFLSWLTLSLSTLVSAFFWRFLRNNDRSSNSFGQFVFGILGNFLGQSFPLRSTRNIKNLLLFLSILVTFVMGNVYQSLIISLMTKSRDGERFMTFDQLFQSDLILRTDEVFKAYMNSSEDSSVNISKLNTEWVRYNESERRNLDNTALIFRCDQLELEFNVLANKNTYEKFYMLAEVRIPMFEKFLLGRRSPFHMKLQKYYDLLFESGIRQFLLRMLETKNQNFIQSESFFISSEGYLFNLNDLYGVFLILIAGKTVSAVIFIIEVAFKAR